MFTMDILIWGEDEEVIHVNDKPSFYYHISEGVVYESLECHRGVGKSKEHYCWFKEAFVRNEGSLPLVAVFGADVVVTPIDVKLGE